MVKPGVGDAFQKQTKYQRGHLPGGGLDWANKPETCKQYPSAPKVRLISPQLTAGEPIWDVLSRRRSVRNFQDTPLTQVELSQLLWATQGITRIVRGFGLRTAPTATSTSTPDTSRKTWPWRRSPWDQIAALYDDEANALLGVDGVTESTIYMTVVGREK